MKREQIYELINDERDYQNQRWGENHDDKNNVCNFIVYMEHHLNKARSLASIEIDDRGALNELRKVVTLGVACFEKLGLPKR